MERLIVWHRWLPPPEYAPEAAVSALGVAKRAEERLLSDGGEVLARIGGTLVVALEAALAIQATEACLALQEEFERQRDADAGAIAHAITIGHVWEDEATRTWLGDAIDRAQALANRARAGEIVLDEAAQVGAAAAFLFAREVAVSAAIRGEALDRKTPRRKDCRRGLRHLQPPALPASAHVQFQAFRQLAQGHGRHRVLLVGSYGVGTNSWLGRLYHELTPPLWLHVSAVAAPLAPLSSLAYALARISRSDHRLERILDPDLPGDSESLQVLEHVREGRAVVRRDVISALRHLLNKARERFGRRAWVSLAPLPLVDPATVAVIADATRDSAPEHLLIFRLAPEDKPPQTFLNDESLAEIRIPALTQGEARAMAQSMLGRSTLHELARRAAAMTGSSPLGVAEAVRVLVASGDIIHDGEKFAWRRGPAGRLSTLSAEALIEERVDQLEPDATRILEIIACVPDPGDTRIVSGVAAADGLGADAVVRAVDDLCDQSLLERFSEGLSINPTLRSVVERGMPPARLAEIHRFIAQELEQTIKRDGFSRATLGYYQARGGRHGAAVEALLDVARTAGQRGFLRSGVRLAAAAVECDPSAETRQRAAQLAQSLNERAQANRRSAEAISVRPMPESDPILPVPSDSAPPLANEAVQQAIDAMIARDFEAVERAIELVVAAGRDGPVVDRLRAMSLLSRGDRDGALRAIDKGRTTEDEPTIETTRALLTRALVLLESDQLESGVRVSLRALARARKAAEMPGERAALQTLALFYRRLGRDPDAQGLELAASSVGTLPRSTMSGS
jgi:hypothetical protein